MKPRRCYQRKPTRKGNSLFVFIMLLFIVKVTFGHGKCYKPCFGPVWKVKIFNELSNGYLHVEGNTVVANYTEDGTVYKISKGASFYLYDPHAGKFICWSNRRVHKKPALVARKYKSQSLRLCEFKDKVSDDEFFRNSHVHLLSSFNQVLRMKYKKCVSAAAFLFIPVESGEDRSDPCACPEARQHLCHTELRHMKELREICSRANETYEV
ncbi:unnamed protein product [Callosobruchus maculatus]|uniref:Uncharacterized protein n=1 Tax=Callosobruchus maculatus TaxID=64391 RepID=A0A653C2S3_CALMS|nr:unnamed protein product [Callosobruchus maculatus]